MRTCRKFCIDVAVLTFLGLVASVSTGRGDQIGVVLKKEGKEAEHLKAEFQNTDRWKALPDLATIFPFDSIRTGVKSRVQTLLELPGSVWTLHENGLMHFTEEEVVCQVRVVPEQKRRIMHLDKGKVRVAVSERADCSRPETEICTPNACICVCGTTVIVRFMPPNTTEVLTLEGTVLIRNFDPEKAPEAQPTDRVKVMEGHSSQVVGNQTPTKPFPLSREALERAQEPRFVAQVQQVVHPTERLLELAQPEEPTRQVEVRVPIEIPGDPSVSPPAMEATRNALVQIILPNPNQ